MEKFIKIENKQYRFRESMRAVIDYQKISTKIEVITLEDQITMMYCLLKNANKKTTETNEIFTYSYEEFLDILDEDMTIFDKLLVVDEVDEVEDNEEDAKKK